MRSIRKSLLGAVYRIHVASGRIDLGETLASLDIDDEPPVLTPVEKQATILDLLHSRSGIYHEAAREPPGRRPIRGSYPPVSFYYYNNLTSVSLALSSRSSQARISLEDFHERIAEPIGMNDFVASDGGFSLKFEATNVGGKSR